MPCAVVDLTTHILTQADAATPCSEGNAIAWSTRAAAFHRHTSCSSAMKDFAVWVRVRPHPAIRLVMVVPEWDPDNPRCIPLQPMAAITAK